MQTEILRRASRRSASDTTVPIRVMPETTDRPQNLTLDQEHLPNLATWLPLLRESLARQGRFRWPLRGASMLPTLPSNCEITIVPLPDKLALGSLIVFAGRDSELVAHRLVRHTDRHLVAQGDARLRPDPWLDPAQVLGLVSAAAVDGRRVWPNRVEALLKWWWVARAVTLWLLRRTLSNVYRWVG